MHSLHPNNKTNDRSNSARQTLEALPQSTLRTSTQSVEHASSKSVSEHCREA